MTGRDFRRLALALPEAVEASHMDHPDFRVGGKIFATLGSPRAGWGTIQLPPADQARLLAAYPEAFTPAAGAWGRSGSTLVRLARVESGVVREALRRAWRKRAPARLHGALDEA